MTEVDVSTVVDVESEALQVRRHQWKGVKKRRDIGLVDLEFK